MRTKELKPGTEYATEAGRLVVTGEAVERGWHMFREGSRQADFQITRELPGDKVPGDPWASAQTSGSRRTANGHSLYDYVEGVRVTSYKVDRDGKRTGDGHDTVVNPKHIKGTWEQYLALHADKVRARFLEKDAEGEARELSKRLSEMLRNAGLKPIKESGRGEEGSSVHVIVYYELKRTDGTSYWSTWTRGEAFQSYKLVPTLTVVGADVEGVLSDVLESGH